MTSAILPRTKKCTKCMIEKCETFFSKDSTKADGLYSSCKDCYSAYYAGARHRRLLLKRKYNAENRDLLAQKKRQWYEKNVEHCLAYAKDYQKRNPISKRVSESKRRSAKAGRSDGNGHTKEQIENLLILQRGRCSICKDKCLHSFHVDHVMPLSKGGSNAISNIQILCPTCNMSKKDRDPVLHMQSKGFLI